VNSPRAYVVNPIHVTLCLPVDCDPADCDWSPVSELRQAQATAKPGRDTQHHYTSHSTRPTKRHGKRTRAGKDIRSGGHAAHDVGL
jgi:hypothetical protein